MKIILASASPRRQELLKNIFSDFIIIKSGSEEQAVFSTPSQYVMDLAIEKAHDAARQLSSSYQDFLIIGADTIVFHNGKVLEKPANEKEAFSMLKSLSGDIHEVYTGVALYRCLSETIQTHSFFCCTKVYVNTLSDEEICTYIATNDCYDKAGGYGIQGPFCKHIASISGDYFNVVGLPVSKLYEELKKIE